MVFHRLIRSILIVPLVLGAPMGRAGDLVLQRAPVQVRFSPKGGCTEAIVEALQGARKTVRVQAYSFTSDPIAKALSKAHDRGVDVRLILDRSQETARSSEAVPLALAGVPVWIDADHGIAHNKVMVIDGETVVTGSFNFTQGGELRNAENLLIIRDASLAGLYAANWEVHLEHSRPLEPHAER